MLQLSEVASLGTGLLENYVVSLLLVISLKDKQKKPPITMPWLNIHMDVSFPLCSLLIGSRRR